MDVIILVHIIDLSVLSHLYCRIDIFHSHSERFLKALDICQKCAKDDLKDVSLGKALGWDDVMAEYGNAWRQYESKAKGWKGLSRKVGRTVGDNAPSVIPFLNFIPEGQYKTLFAGLHLIFAVSVVVSKGLESVCNKSIGCRSDEQSKTTDPRSLQGHTTEYL